MGADDSSGGDCRMSGAAYNTGKSKQDYETPADFIKAAEARFGSLTLDLAATAANMKAPAFLADAFAADWPTDKLCWLDPPFAHIEPWAKKCHESGSHVLFLVPASTGAKWFIDYVYMKALVLFLHPRIPFDITRPKWGFPKDCILAVFGEKPGFQTWRWK